jgi:hypothetical protein
MKSDMTNEDRVHGLFAAVLAGDNDKLDPLSLQIWCSAFPWPRLMPAYTMDRMDFLIY